MLRGVEELRNFVLEALRVPSLLGKEVIYRSGHTVQVVPARILSPVRKSRYVNEPADLVRFSWNQRLQSHPANDLKFRQEVSRPE